MVVIDRCYVMSFYSIMLYLFSELRQEVGIFISELVSSLLRNQDWKIEHIDIVTQGIRDIQGYRYFFYLIQEFAKYNLQIYIYVSI